MPLCQYRQWCQRRDRASRLQILPRRVRSPLPHSSVDVSPGISWTCMPEKAPTMFMKLRSRRAAGEDRRIRPAIRSIAGMNDAETRRDQFANSRVENQKAVVVAEPLSARLIKFVCVLSVINREDREEENLAASTFKAIRKSIEGLQVCKIENLSDIIQRSIKKKRFVQEKFTII